MASKWSAKKSAASWSRHRIRRKRGKIIKKIFNLFFSSSARSVLILFCSTIILCVFRIHIFSFCSVSECNRESGQCPTAREVVLAERENKKFINSVSRVNSWRSWEIEKRVESKWKRENNFCARQQKTHTRRRIKKIYRNMIMMRNISSNKVPAIKSLNAIIILTLLILNGVVHCNDSNNLNLSPLETPHQPNQQQHQPPQRRVAGSGGGQLEKQRSSYAVISQAFTDTVNNEFGSESFFLIFSVLFGPWSSLSRRCIVS